MAPRLLSKDSLTSSTALLFYVALVNFAIHLWVAGNYGYFRDELYYIVSGQHLQLGYVDFPPMIAYIAALLGLLAGDGLVAIHVVPALAGSAVVFVTGLTARELGGNKWAQVLAAVSALVTAQLAFASLFSMDILDVLWWSLGAYILIRIIHRDEPRLWLVFGLVAGLGLLTKLTIVFFLVSLVVGLLATSQRRQLRTKWFWIGAAIAVLFLVPYIVWNATNGWPTVDFYFQHGGLNGGGPADFILLQVLIMNPVNIPVVIAGLYFYLRSPLGDGYRLLGVALVFLYALFVVINGKPYFYEAAYPILIAAGAVVVSQTRFGEVRRWTPRALLVALVIAGAILAPLEMPLLQPGVFASTYSAATGAANAAGAQGNAGQFTQYLGDRFGWDTMTATVSQAFNSLPASERSQACVFASNYGEASALIFLGKGRGLPDVISSHNNFYVWGPGSCGSVLITVGVDPATLEQTYRNVTQVAVITCDYCMTSENDLPVYVATNPTVPLASIWASLKIFA